MTDRNKEILDAAQAFAEEYEFNENRFRSETQFSAANESGHYTVKLAPHPPGYVVEASTPKISEGVHKFLEDRLGTNLPARAPIRSNLPVDRKAGVLTAQDIINYINPKATEQEAYLFAEFCKRKGADPMTKQVYLVIYEGQNGRQASFIAGKEYFTEKAEAHPQFDGFEAGIIVRLKEGGALEHRQGTFWCPDEEKLLGGWATVHRKDRGIPVKIEVPLSDYDTKKKLWDKMPATMIRKVALVQALREAFPANFGGMYDRSEMDQAIDPAKEVAV